MPSNMNPINIDLTLWSPALDGKMRGFDKSGSTPLDVRAFPNAQGLAALTRGAAGYSGTKTLAFVDNLNDSGAGSLREAIEGAGKEGTFVIFRTSGVINLSSIIYATSNYITFCFQTSPSGISVVGAPINIVATDYIIRHGRFRCGSHQPIGETNQESLSIYGGSDNIMVANCSLTWGGDETIGLTSYPGPNTPFTNITFYECNIGEGLTDAATEENNHGYGILLNGGYSPNNTADFVRPLLSSSNGRLPQWSGDITSSIYNAVVYNFDGAQSSMLDMQGDSSPRVNSFSCMTKAGVDSNGSIRGGSGNAAEYIALGPNDNQNVVIQTPYPALYQRRAFGTDRLLDTDDEWSIANGFSSTYLPTTFESLTPFPLEGGIEPVEILINESNYEAVMDQVVSGVGATVPIRDSVDTNMVNNYFNTSGTLRANTTYPDDFPVYDSADYPVNTADDGIADEWWEFRNIVPKLWSEKAPSDYLWIEEYVNDLADKKFIPTVTSLKAFIGAEGVGTDTIGGRGGTIYTVTTLADSGVGSLREAVEASVPRIIVFAVSGTINLLTDLSMYNPFCTIAGQTSPGGIIVSGRTTAIRTHDVICRFVRFRTGTQSTTLSERETLRSLAVDGNNYNGVGNADAYNVVVDHCSLSWSADQCLNAQNDAYDVTFSWNFIAEPLTSAAGEANHGYALFYWGAWTDPSREYSAHHNFIAHSQGRNPQIGYNGKLDLVNNVTYNMQRGFSVQIEAATAGSVLVNAIRNFNKYGPSNTGNTNKAYINMRDNYDSSSLDNSVFVEGNIGPHRTLNTDPNINSVSHTTYSGGFTYTHPVPSSYLLTDMIAFGKTVSATVMDENYAQTVVDAAGATIPVRDAVDIRVAADFTNGTGGLKATSSYPADWPDLETGAPAPLLDTNGDGIPDAYEVFRGRAVGSLSPNGTAPNQYTWMDEYLNDLANGSFTNA